MNDKNFIRVVFFAVLLLLSFSLSYGAQANVFVFQQVSGIRIEILSQEEFTARFGNNPDIPRTDAEIINLAKKLFPPLWEQHRTNKEFAEMCIEYKIGVLFAALQNPIISDSTRLMVDLIMQESEPSLPKTYTNGHFKFRYTDNDSDPDNNSTLADIKKTAVLFNAYWNNFKINFKTPKHYHEYILFGKELIDIKVYNYKDAQGAEVPGATNSSWDYIILSSKSVVNDNCYRKTTSAHELFHRVQYSYGYLSGTADIKWCVEGTAKWSQKYTNQNIRDYMYDMNKGLFPSDRALISDRSYDAVHFWVYLEERINWNSIRDVWKTYEINGKDAKAAVETIVSNGLGTNFEGYVQLWNKANYIKDLNNASFNKYDYKEDETTKTSCDRLYGPLDHSGSTVKGIF